MIVVIWYDRGVVIRTETPLVFAHRGSSVNAAEHTLPAYRIALAEGVDGVECDVRLTRDGHLVCLHDRRVNRTSDGRGPVSKHTLQQLHQLDFGSRHTHTGRSDPERVLTFDRLVRETRDAGRPIELLVETKHPTRHGGSVEQALCAALRRHGLDRPPEDRVRTDNQVRVTVMSFSVLALRRIRQLTPGVATALLLEYVPPGLRHGGLPFGAQVGGPSVRLLRSHPYLGQRLRERGNRVYVWTVNEPAELDLVLAAGVDGIISDRPAEILSQLRHRGLRG